jgi:hypothetical protein
MDADNFIFEKQDMPLRGSDQGFQFVGPLLRVEHDANFSGLVGPESGDV